jgi:hypothetical protein
MMAPPVPIDLPRRTDAPILNTFVGHIETVLRKFRDDLVGDGTAEQMTLPEIGKMGDPPLSEGDMVSKYNADKDQVNLYKTDLNSFDVNVADIAKNSAGIAKDVNDKLTKLVSDIDGIFNGIPQKPSILEQFNAIGKIDTLVDDMTKEVSDANKKLHENAGNVNDPIPRPSYGNAAHPGGGHNYAPGSGTPSMGNLTNAEAITTGQKAEASKIYEYLIQKGFTPAQAAGILGNMQVESGFDTGAYNPAEGAIGLCQWEGGRRTALEAFAAGRDIGDWHTQVDFMMSELSGSESGALGHIKSAQTPGDAAAAFDQFYERSSGEARGQRVANANSIAQTLGANIAV